jgi:hypothetical protein
VGSNERSGLPLKGRGQAQPVRVDLAVVFGQAAGSAGGIVTTQLVAGGLSRWLRTADGAWVGVVTYVATMTDGTTMKCADQLLPAHALTRQTSRRMMGSSLIESLREGCLRKCRT